MTLQNTHDPCTPWVPGLGQQSLHCAFSCGGSNKLFLGSDGHKYNIHAFSPPYEYSYGMRGFVFHEIFYHIGYIERVYRPSGPSYVCLRCIYGKTFCHKSNKHVVFLRVTPYELTGSYWWYISCRNVGIRKVFLRYGSSCAG